jgi:hypothetical protein
MVITRHCECRHIWKSAAANVGLVFLYEQFGWCQHSESVLEVPLIPKPQDCSPISFRRACAWCGVKVHHRLALGGELGAQFTAGAGFSVQRLRDRCWPARVAQLKHFDFEVSAFGSDLQHVANVNIASRLDRLPLALNPAEFACASSHAARFEETRCPQPFIETHASHVHILTVSEALPRQNRLRTQWAQQARQENQN